MLSIRPKCIMLAAFLTCAWTAQAQEVGLLDGQSFTGMIGPSETPDLPDTLHFNDGNFWSDICANCGFVPGEYDSQKINGNIEFSGTLESEGRGRFDYVGIVAPQGNIRVEITWKRRRWYWTSSRELVFVGRLTTGMQSVSMLEVVHQMEISSQIENPLCARF